MNEETSKHVVQVLRMAEGEKLHLTDGKGNLITASVADAHRKHCSVKIESTLFTPQETGSVTIAISPLKNNSRFEWFLEKATEIGVNNIIPINCNRTEKEKLKVDRLRQILISAMLQSRQVWLPTLYETTNVKELFHHRLFNTAQEKYIAHCMGGEKKPLPATSQNSSIILIGPEGDFTVEEINVATENDCIPVTLGNTRLRTETAGIVAAVLLSVK